MGQNGIKMKILWLKQFQWQTCKYQKTYSRPKPIVFTFYKLKSVFFESIKDGGLNFASSRGSLAKNRSKGYVLFLSVRSWSNGGKRLGKSKGTDGKPDGGAMAGSSPELAVLAI